MAIKSYTPKSVDRIIELVRSLTFVDESDRRSVDVCLDERYALSDADMRWFESLLQRSVDGVCPAYIHGEHPTQPIPEEPTV